MNHLNLQKQNDILLRQTRESDWVEIRAVVIGVILVSFITVRCSTPPSYYICILLPMILGSRTGLWFGRQVDR
jgi:hypothetical protein